MSSTGLRQRVCAALLCGFALLAVGCGRSVDGYAVVDPAEVGAGADDLDAVAKAIGVCARIVPAVSFVPRTGTLSDPERRDLLVRLDRSEQIARAPETVGATDPVGGALAAYADATSAYARVLRDGGAVATEPERWRVARDRLFGACNGVSPGLAPS